MNRIVPSKLPGSVVTLRVCGEYSRDLVSRRGLRYLVLLMLLFWASFITPWDAWFNTEVGESIRTCIYARLSEH